MKYREAPFIRPPQGTTTSDLNICFHDREYVVLLPNRS